MLTQKELVKTPEYWMETIQNDLYRQVKKFLDEKGMNQSQLAKKLKVTKGYVSQVMNGNFNYTLGKLIELSLAIGVAPDLEFRSLSEYIEKEQRIQYEAGYFVPPAQGLALQPDKRKSFTGTLAQGQPIVVRATPAPVNPSYLIAA